jgi:hypothetical protein
MTRAEELKNQIATLEKAIASPSTPEQFKGKLKDKKAAAEKELAEVESKKEPEKKAKPQKEAKRPAKKSSGKVVTIGGKEYVKDSPEHCAALAEMWEKRRSQARKNAKKATKTGVFETITDKVGATVEKAIRTSVKENKKAIKKDPSGHIKKYVELKKAARAFLIQFRSVLGDKYKSGELEDFEKRINEMISTVKTEK